MAEPLVFALPGNESFAERLALAIDSEFGTCSVRQFPDGESYVRLDSPPGGRSTILCCTLDRPDRHFLPIAFMASTARELGAVRVGLVAPYLAYMRQDRRFRDGEAVTSTIFAKLLSDRVDWLVTVDPHLHRFKSLGELYAVPATVVHAEPILGAWIARHVQKPLVIGPDAESVQWASAVGAEAKAPVIVLQKTRRSDTDVLVSVPDAASYRDRTPVLVDDIISTGQTMIATVHHLREIGLHPPVCVAVHAVFAPGALGALHEAGAARIVTTNTIAHETNAIDILPELAEAVHAHVATR